MKLLRFTLVVLSGALLPTAAEASIVIGGSTIRSEATNGVGPDAFHVYPGTTIPTSTTLTAADGLSLAVTDIDWSASGGDSVLSFDLRHQFGPHVASGTHLVRTARTVQFSAGSDMTYDLSGTYVAMDVVDGTFGPVSLFVSLIDVTSGSILFLNGQRSSSTTDETFTVGGLGGDATNSLMGSLTGNLVAGRVYSLNIDASIRSGLNANYGASALGNITLALSETTAVPEPLSALVWGGLATVAAAVATHRHGIKPRPVVAVRGPHFMPCNSITRR